MAAGRCRLDPALQLAVGHGLGHPKSVPTNLSLQAALCSKRLGHPRRDRTKRSDSESAGVGGSADKTWTVQLRPCAGEQDTWSVEMLSLEKRQRFFPHSCPSFDGVDANLTWLAIVTESSGLEAIATMPVVRPYDWRLPIVIESDASERAVGASLFQHLRNRDGRRVLHRVAYFSQKLTATQARFSAQERELMGILLSLKHWQEWIECNGNVVTIITGHGSLASINIKKDQPSRIDRYLDSLEYFAVRILYRPSKVSLLTNFALRRQFEPCRYFEKASKAAKDESERKLKPAQASIKRITDRDQLKPVTLEAIREYLAAEKPLPSGLAADWVRTYFRIQENRLFTVFTYNGAPRDPLNASGKPTSSTVLLPVLGCEEFYLRMKQTHLDHGHCNIGALCTSMLRSGWYPQAYRTCQEILDLCEKCQLMNQNKAAISLARTTIALAMPLDRWIMDFTTSYGGNLLMAVDDATGIMRAQVSPDQSMRSAKALCDSVRNSFGIPAEIILDKAFFNDPFKGVWTPSHTRVLYTLPGYTRTNHDDRFV